MTDAAETPPPNHPPRIARLLAVVRRLIDYGRQLTDNLGQRAAAPDFPYFARTCFGTTDLARIGQRILLGLRRAAALEGLLLKRASRGRDVTPPPIRHRSPSGSVRASSAAPGINLAPARAPAEQNAPPASLPSVEQIASEIRRRPFGAVIVDICLDLGIKPGHLDRAFWDELHEVMMIYGGNLIRFFRIEEGLRRSRRYIEILRSDAPLPPELQPFPFLKQLGETRAGPP